MRNVTVSLEDEIYHRARVRAAELGTSLSALVRGCLEDLGTDETEAERLRKAEFVLKANIVAFSAVERPAGDLKEGAHHAGAHPIGAHPTGLRAR